MKYSLYSDGNRFPKANKSGFGGYITDENGNVLVEYTQEITDPKYHHGFELLGIIRGLELAKLMDIKHITSHCDDKGTIRKLGQIYDIANHEPFKDLYDRIIELSKDFESVDFIYIPRKENKHSDALSRRYVCLLENNYLNMVSQKIKEDSIKIENRENNQKKYYFSHPSLVEVPYKENPFILANDRNKKQKVFKAEAQKEFNTYVLFDFVEEIDSPSLRKAIKHIDIKIHQENNWESFLKHDYNPHLSLVENYAHCFKKMSQFLKQNEIKQMWCYTNNESINAIFDQEKEFSNRQFNSINGIYKQMSNFDKILYNRIPVEIEAKLEKTKKVEFEDDKELIQNLYGKLEEIKTAKIEDSLYKIKRNKYFGQLMSAMIRQLRKEDNIVLDDYSKYEFRENLIKDLKKKKLF